MSFSSGSGRSSFNKTGHSSAQRKEKKRKQEFHKHKIKFIEQKENIDFDQLKERVSVALDKLGHQIFSTEPGGYTFHNWMRSFNMLLDDFEERAGSSNLPKEYYDARLKFSADLVEPADTTDLDAEIQKSQVELDSLKLRVSEITQGKAKFAKKQYETKSKINGLKKKRAESDEELKEATSELEQQEKKRKSFFSRLLSNAPIDSALERVNLIKKRTEEIEEDLKKLQAEAPVEDLDAELANTREKLEELAQKIGELNAHKLECQQLTKKRKEVTGALSAIISSLRKLDNAGPVQDIPASGSASS